ncbi:MAG: VanW family protein [Oscillospiraceae bacterium]|nr:VanW family protein [Oscillospiraceae bacterium]
MLLALVIGCAAGAVAVRNIDTFYPKVTVDGIDIGGMSLTEAVAAVNDVYSESADNSVTVLLPMDNTLVVTAEDAGVAKSSAEIVRSAWDTMRGSNAAAGLISYLKCCFVGMDITTDDITEIDETAVRAMIENVVYEVNLALMNNDMTIGEDSIVVVKGASSITIDTDEVYALVRDAILSGSFGTIEYDGVINGDELDLQTIYDTVCREPQDAEYDPETDSVTEHINGISFSIDEARSAWDAADYGDEVVIPLTITEPEVTTEYLESILFADLLSSKSTSLSGSSSNRISNVTLAAESCNNTVLMPGEQFDYNTTLGERTAENGYLEAGAYSNGETVMEYGGGICQVSSTIYYCALYANLTINSRTCHYFPVSYVPPGLDATVSWGGPEFRFTNNRDYPIRILSWVENGQVYVEIWGTDVDGSYVEMTYGTEAVYDGEYTSVQVGYKAYTYRSVYDSSGTLLSRSLESSSYYHYHDADIAWPEETAEPTATPEPTAEPTPTPTETPAETEAPAVTETPAAEPAETTPPTDSGSDTEVEPTTPVE